MFQMLLSMMLMSNNFLGKDGTCRSVPNGCSFGTPSPEPEPVPVRKPEPKTPKGGRPRNGHPAANSNSTAMDVDTTPPQQHATAMDVDEGPPSSQSRVRGATGGLSDLAGRLPNNYNELLPYIAGMPGAGSIFGPPC
jgi:hypothetical protein